MLNIDFGASFSIPVFPGFTYDHSFGSTIRDIGEGNLSIESIPHTITNTIGQTLGASVSVGLSNINNSNICSEEWSVNIGASKYLGISLRFLQKQDKSLSVLNPARYIDALKINIGIGVPAPISVTDEDIVICRVGTTYRHQGAIEYIWQARMEATDETKPSSG